MICLKKSILMCTKLLEFSLEQFMLMVCDLFLIKNKNVGDVIVMDLLGC